MHIHEGGVQYRTAYIFEISVRITHVRHYQGILQAISLHVNGAMRLEDFCDVLSFVVDRDVDILIHFICTTFSSVLAEPTILSCGATTFMYSTRKL